VDEESRKDDPEKQQICDLRIFSSLSAAALANIMAGRDDEAMMR